MDTKNTGFFKRISSNGILHGSAAVTAVMLAPTFYFPAATLLWKAAAGFAAFGVLVMTHEVATDARNAIEASLGDSKRNLATKATLLLLSAPSFTSKCLLALMNQVHEEQAEVRRIIAANPPSEAEIKARKRHFKREEARRRYIRIHEYEDCKDSSGVPL